MSATDEIKNYYLSLGIKESVYDFCEATEQALLPRFQEIDRIAEQNQIKVISAMQKAGFSESHLNGTTGYGYNDRGREAVEEIYAHVFHTEDALVSCQTAAPSGRAKGLCATDPLPAPAAPRREGPAGCSGPPV